MQKNKNYLIIILILLGVGGRLIPHIPNITPLLSLSLFAGMNLPRWQAVLSLIVILLLADLGLALLFNYPIIGYWSLFNYIGFIMIVIVAAKLQFSWQKLLPSIFSASLGFWLWSNLGVWLTTKLYPQTLVGLAECYIAALPFLRNSLLGDTLWGLAIFGFFEFILSKLWSRRWLIS